MLPDFKKYLTYCSAEELKEIEATVKQITEAQKKEQFTRLVKNFVNARKELKEAFPTATCYVDVWLCDEDVDFLDYNLSEEMFDR